MSAQFFHISLYGSRQRLGAERHETAVGMLNEAARRPSATTHIQHPKAARHLFGASPAAIVQDVKNLAQISKDSCGRKLRADAHLLMCLVASYPRVRSEVADGDEEYQAWLSLVLEWLQKQFGAYLTGVVEHRDETYLHIHGFVLPPVATDGQLQWEVVHPGRCAKKLAAAANASKRDQDLAYVNAMQECQNDFHQAVGEKFGHARVSNQRQRRPRAEHLHIRALEADNARLVARVQVLEMQLNKLTHGRRDHPLDAAPELEEVSGDVIGDYNPTETDQYVLENAAEHAECSSPELNSDNDLDPEQSDFDDELEWDTYIDSDWHQEIAQQLENTDD